MKMKSSLLIVILFLSAFAFSQKKEKLPYPRSFIEVGLGAGPNHGMVGAQVLIGYKGNGLLLGGGIFGGEVGLQGGYKWMYASIAFGAYNIVSDGTSVYALNGISIMGGVKLNLHRAKKWYFQLGAGYSGGDYISTPAGSIPVSGFNLSIGFGYRIAFKKKDSSPEEKQPIGG
jgi:hypothetical protein